MTILIFLINTSSKYNVDTDAKIGIMTTKQSIDLLSYKFFYCKRLSCMLYINAGIVNQVTINNPGLSFNHIARLDKGSNLRVPHKSETSITLCSISVATFIRQTNL